MSTSVLLTDIVNEHHQHREGLLALIAISSLVGWSVKKMTCLALIMTFSKSIPLLKTILVKTEICCGAVSLKFTATSPKWKQELAIRGLKSCCCWKLSVFFECRAAQKLFQCGRIHTISGEIKQTDKGHKKKEVCIFAYGTASTPF